MSKTVEDGVLRQLSPSSINKFDATAAFGCERRWWFRYVKGLDEPQLGNQFLGESVHALIEARLTKRELGMEVDPEANGIYLAGEAMIEDVAKRSIIGVEMPIADFKLDGVRVNGYVDVVTSDGIIDWKTSSDIRRYGKNEADLARDTQMAIYARAMHPDLEVVKLAHGQFQTKGNKRTAFVEVEVSQKHLAEYEDKVIVPLVQKMKSAASESDVRKLSRNEKSCFNCAYKTHCPSPEGEHIMSFFSKMKSTPASSLLAGGLQNEVTKPAPIAPPDAPESKPELAAKPVEGFEAVPPPRRMLIVDVPAPSAAEVAHVTKTTEQIDKEEQQEKVESSERVEQPKKKAGRPPGAKNKPKAGDLSTAVSPLAEQVQSYLEQPQQPVTLTSLTVSKGVTINVGAFNSVRFDVSATAEGSDYAMLEEFLMAKVEESLEREAAKYQAEVDSKTHATAPAKDVVCK